MRLGNANLRIGARAALARELERDHAREVRLQREHLQIEHQLDVLLPDLGHAWRAIDSRYRRLGVLTFRALDAPLDLPDRVEILIDLRPIAGAELPLQAGHVGHDPVEDAGVLLQLRAPPLRGSAVAEQALEDHPRIGLGRQRRGRRRPRQIVLVRAGVAVVAVADLRDQVDAELQGRNGRVAPDGAGGDLVDRGAVLVVGALGPLRARAAEEAGVRRGVVPRGVGVLELEVREDREVLEIRRQCGKRRRERRDPSDVRRRPRDGVGPHRDIDEAQPSDRCGRRHADRGERRHHGVQERQRKRGAKAAQERPARKRHLRDDHSNLLIWNGWLLAIASTSDEKR